MIAGVDEAGRGPVVGPLVIAVVAGDGEALRRLGVRDSKKLTPGAREALYREVLRVAECVNYVVVEPHEVDRYASRGLLNALELDYTARLIKLCPADVYYVDSPDVDADRYGSGLSFLTGRRVVALHKGEKVPQVAAASIVAKVVRDRLLEVVKREVGDFGSGYPSDRRTVEWLRAGLVPRECVRWSWGTVGKLFK
ncbi:MAG: ribonuclease HII [Pyrobaculum sp.]